METAMQPDDATERLIADTKKLHAEADKLMAESRKLVAEESKLEAEAMLMRRNRMIAPWHTIVLALAAGAGLYSVLLRLIS